MKKEDTSPFIIVCLIIILANSCVYWTIKDCNDFNASNCQFNGQMIKTQLMCEIEILNLKCESINNELDRLNKLLIKQAEAIEETTKSNEQSNADNQ